MSLKKSPVIIVQAGAGTYERSIKLKGAQLLEDGCKNAAKDGYRVLHSGGSAVDAVVAAVASFEDNECFNAGKGSHLTATREIELDASVMDGKSLRVGGVTCVKSVKNPIKLAKLVMEKCNAVLLCGDAAEDLAKQHTDVIEFTSRDYFVTEYAKSRLDEYYKEKEMGITSTDLTMTHVQKTEPSDTVGAVALDQDGNLAYATSTGGVVGKEPGRIGDSPIVGCGGYADNNVCAVTTTGIGEAILKVSLAKHVHLLMEQGLSAQEASKAAIDYMQKKVGAYAGVVTLSKSGETGIYFNSHGMIWTMIRDNALSWGITKDEVQNEKLE